MIRRINEQLQPLATAMRRCSNEKLQPLTTAMSRSSNELLQHEALLLCAASGFKHIQPDDCNV